LNLYISIFFYSDWNSGFSDQRWTSVTKRSWIGNDRFHKAWRHLVLDLHIWWSNSIGICISIFDNWNYH